MKYSDAHVRRIIRMARSATRELQERRSLGSMLSNIAFNLSQSHPPRDWDRVATNMRETVRDWDAIPQRVSTERLAEALGPPARRRTKR